jgi:type I restriction enzyme M protein
MADKTHREFTEEDIAKVSNTYHEWRKRDGKYEDTAGFSKSAKLAEVIKNNFILTPGRYVGTKDEIDDGISFEEKMEGLTKKLSAQITEEKKLDEEIKKQLKNVGFDL